MTNANPNVREPRPFFRASVLLLIASFVIFRGCFNVRLADGVGLNRNPHHYVGLGALPFYCFVKREGEGSGGVWLLFHLAVVCDSNLPFKEGRYVVWAELRKGAIVCEVASAWSSQG